uniref:Uncharacterized protein n=1 Tax=Alexandrium monilatum TaxID=311494 RepID=A0A7S4VNL9_9DINO
MWHAWDVQQQAAFLLGGVLAMLNVLLLLVKFQAYLAYLRTLVKGALAACARACRTTCRERSEMDAIIDAKIVEQKAERMLWLSQLLLHMFFLHTVVYLAGVRMHALRAFTPLQDSAYVAMYSTLFLAQLPRAVPKRVFVDVYFSALMALTAVMCAPFACTREAALQMVGLANFLSPMLMLTLPSLAVAVFWSACVALSACTTLWLNAPLEGISSPELVVLCEAGLCLASLGLSRFIEASGRAELRAVLTSQDVCEVHRATLALLHSFCDVVVELDGEGRIAVDAMDLAGFLLQSRSLKGLAITDLVVSEEDRELLKSKLSRPGVGGGSRVDCIHLCMRDTNCKILKVELFFISYESLHVRTRYVAGIREFGVWRPHATRGLRRPLGLRTNEEDVVDDLWEEQKVYVVVDAATHGLPVVSYTSVFGTRIGRVPKSTPIMNYVDQGATFLTWVQEMTNHKMFDGEDVDNPEFHARLRTRKGRMTAVITVELDDDGSSSDEAERSRSGLLVRLYFRRITWKPSKGTRSDQVNNSQSSLGSSSALRQPGSSGNTLLSFHSSQRQPATGSSSSTLPPLHGGQGRLPAGASSAQRGSETCPPAQNRSSTRGLERQPPAQGSSGPRGLGRHPTGDASGSLLGSERPGGAPAALPGRQPAGGGVLPPRGGQRQGARAPRADQGQPPASGQGAAPCPSRRRWPATRISDWAEPEALSL